MDANRLFGMASLILLLFISCNGQINTPAPNDSNKAVGGNFENGEWIYNGKPQQITATDTSAGWNQQGQKILITGVVYQSDAKTPAAGVLVYYYHTNTAGRYVHLPEVTRSMPPNELGQTHGYLRGWVKTGADGRYVIYTIKPGTYPTRDAPAHIHLTVKEPNDIKEYYIDDVVFDDDRLLTTAYRKNMENRAGSGLVRLAKKDNIMVGERDIFLGMNIPNYPLKNELSVSSGKNIGEDVLSFGPFHAWGPDKGSKACPVCKYGWYHGILYFVGNKPNWPEIRDWLVFLEQESEKREQHLKVYFVYGNEQNYAKTSREKELVALGEELNLSKVALTFVPSFSDTLSEVDLLGINPQVENTFILYKRSRIIDKFINLQSTAENKQRMSSRLDETVNAYFLLPSIHEAGGMNDGQ